MSDKKLLGLWHFLHWRTTISKMSDKKQNCLVPLNKDEVGTLLLLFQIADDEIGSTPERDELKEKLNTVYNAFEEKGQTKNDL